MKSKLRSCIALFFLLLVGCQNQDENLTEKEKIQEIPSEKDGVTLSTEKNKYTTSTDTITVFTKNKSDSKVKSSHGIKDLQYLKNLIDLIVYLFHI